MGGGGTWSSGWLADRYVEMAAWSNSTAQPGEQKRESWRLVCCVALPATLPTWSLPWSLSKALRHRTASTKSISPLRVGEVAHTGLAQQ